jgi:PIN domain nuclease of toxin-antitoxin system
MILLDTPIWHWWVNQIPCKSSSTIISSIEEAEQVGVSAISGFEMAWLVRHGRIDLGMTFDEWLYQIEKAMIIEFLPIIPAIAAKAIELPEHHRDPMARLIISTALYYHAELLSFDKAFAPYQEIGLRLIAIDLKLK